MLSTTSTTAGYASVAIYGALDTFSRKILYIFVWESNSDPNVVGQRYIKHFYESERMPIYIRIDRGTETGKLATVHAFLINKQRAEADGTDFVLCGPSTTNKIERWWRELHEQMEKFFTLQLLDLLNRTVYDPHNLVDRKLLAFVFSPVIQRDCEIFMRLRNTHRIRQQKGLALPTGIPNHMYSFPENYSAIKGGFSLKREDIREVAELSGILEAPVDYLDAELREDFEFIICSESESENVAHAFEFLKTSLKDR